jgi:surface polysaccharide O-acyltransferase-like enzyme
MFLTQLSQFLILLWKLSSVFVIPLIIIAYVMVMSHYDQRFTFAELDQGKNIHKWLVFAIYLAYLLFWNRSNGFVVAYLKKLQY